MNKTASPTAAPNANAVLISKYTPNQLLMVASSSSARTVMQNGAKRNNVSTRARIPCKVILELRNILLVHKT